MARTDQIGDPDQLSEMNDFNGLHMIQDHDQLSEIPDTDENDEKQRGNIMTPPHKYPSSSRSPGDGGGSERKEFRFVPG